MATEPTERVRADIAVVGAGPAGLAAAVAAAESGAEVTLIDAGARAGGQFWRAAARATGTGQHHWSTFLDLQRRLERAGVRSLQQCQVQTVEPAGRGGWRLGLLAGPEPRQATAATVLHCRRIVLATGAYDRQVPFPGWDLTGVMTAGGVQALLKGHGVVSGTRLVVAGTGPFLLPVAVGLLAAGADVAAVVEASSPSGFAGHPAALAASPAKLAEAAGYLARLRRARTPYLRRRAVVRAVGGERVEAVEIARLDRGGHVAPGRTEHIACDALAVGWGFTPDLALGLQLGCASAIGGDGSLVLDVDGELRTGVPGVWAAGEVTGVGGSDLALVEGRIAGLSAAGHEVNARLHSRRARLTSFAAALHAVHPVPPFLIEQLPEDTLACRCEEVPARAIREAVRDWGATDTRSVKMFTRVGMGWCQGRVCGYAAANLTARACARDVTVGDLRAVAGRPFTVPAPLRILEDTAGDSYPDSP